MAFKKKNRKVEEVKEEVTTPVVADAEIKEEKEEKEVPFYVIEKIYNPGDKNMALEVPPGYVYFKDAVAQRRLDELESKLVQMCAFFLGIDLTKKEEKTEEATEEKTETQE